jgi:uncharacterized membrane protein YphA (DoxX/SURF4 family)
MHSRIRSRDLPTRLATGAYVLHAGLEKRRVEAESAKGLHGMASGAFPFLGSIEPERFQRLLSAGEITVGALLLAPFVPRRLAGLALTAFSGSLLTMYLRTPSLHKEGSVWPTPAGIGVSKDVWMLGIGIGLLAPSDAAD